MKTLTLNMEFQRRLNDLKKFKIVLQNAVFRIFKR